MTSHGLTSSRFWLLAFGVLALASAFRLWDLGAAPIWMDEAYTILVARLPMHDILFGSVDNHPPLSYAIERLWLMLTPSLDLARAPAAIVGVATVAVLMAAMRDLVSKLAALWAGLFLSLSTSHIYHSQDARMYPFLVFGLAIACWGLAGLARDAQNRSVAYPVLYLMGALIAVYSHVAALLFLFAANLGALLYLLMDAERRRAVASLVIVNALLFVASLPWLSRLAVETGAFPGLGRPGFYPNAFAFFLRNALGFPGLPRAVDYAGLVLVLGACAGGLTIALRTRRGPLIAVFGTALTLYPLLLLAVNLKTSILATRVLLPLLLPVIVFAALAIAEWRPRALASSLAALLVSLGLAAAIHDDVHRTKHDNPEAALRFAASQGLAAAPVVTCMFFDAAAVMLTAERLRLPQPLIVTMKDGQYLRFDADYFHEVTKSLARLRRLPPAELDSSLGGGHLFPGGLNEALRGYDHAVFVSGGCVDEASLVNADIQRAGFTQITTRAFGNEGRIAIEKGETQVFLFARDPARDRPDPPALEQAHEAKKPAADVKG